MTAVSETLEVEQGATFYHSFAVKTGVTDETGEVVSSVPLDLTGCTLRMQIRKTQGSAILFEADNTEGDTLGSNDSGFFIGLDLDDADNATPDPTNGWVRLRITADDTDEISTKSALYDIELVAPSGRVYRLKQGKVIVSPNITQITPDDPVVEN